MMSDQQTEQQPTFQYSVRIERTAKGARWSIHCYGKDLQTCEAEAIRAYDEIGQKLADKGLAVAPAESGGKGE
jgi:hypothetical protein